MNGREKKLTVTKSGEQIQSNGADKIEVTCRRVKKKMTDLLSKSFFPLLTAKV